MDVIIIAIIALVVLVVAIIVTGYIRKQRKRTDRQIQDNESFRKRAESAVWAKALIVNSRASVAPNPSAVIPMSLTMEVTPPDGKPYRAQAQWSVDLSALGYVAQGQEVAVKIDREDAGIIYPNASWAKYIPS
jgi:heme/copper-type cytochrome/quinol oxidase subunit 2